MKALADSRLRGRARYRVLGPVAVMEAAAREAGISPYWRVSAQAGPVADADVVVMDYGRRDFPRQADRGSGDLSFRLVEDSILHARRPKEDPLHCDAVVTGPISKLAWQMAGRGQYPGHTELFATRCGAKRFGMMFVSPRLKVILATAHVPLMDVRGVLTTEKVLDVIELGDEACRRMGILRPRVAVCGLNPHAGEGGMLGQEDGRVIEPAIRAAVERGIDAKGPFPGDTVFIAAVEGKFDLVVAMYHDQGLIPVKLLDRDRAVNVTVGLPIVRTSPDHGTAFDIAGMNKADAGSMKAAIELAVEMVGEGRKAKGEGR